MARAGARPPGRVARHLDQAFDDAVLLALAIAIAAAAALVEGHAAGFRAECKGPWEARARRRDPADRATALAG